MNDEYEELVNRLERVTGTSLSRRQLLQRGAGGAAALSLGGLLAACGGSSGSGASGTGTQGALATGAVKKGGTLSFAVDAVTGGADPGTFNSFGDWMAIDCIARGLTHIDYQTTTVQPALATSWEVSADGRTYTFHLRQGVKFHDGTTLTATDCVRTFRRLMNPNDPTRAAGTYAITELGGPNVKAVSAPNAATFVVKLVDPDVAFLARLSNPNGVILSGASLDKYGKKVGNHLVGAGPFKFVSSQPGQNYQLEAFDGFYAGAPSLSKVVLQALPDPTALTSALTSGSITASCFAPFTSVRSLQGNPNVTVYRPKRYIDIFAQMSAADPVLGSLQARQAVNYCIDRKACNQQAFLGLGQQPGYMVSPPELGFSESLVPYSTQNLAKAKQLVASSGIAGKSVNVICQNSLFWPQLGQILDQDLKAIGLKPTTRYLDTGTFTKIVTDPTQYSIALYQRSAFVPDPDNKLSPLLTADGAGSEVAIAKLPAPVQNQVQKMLAQAKSTTNQAQRAALYVNLQKYVIANEMNYSMMQNIFTPVASAKTLNNLNADALGTYRLFLEKTGFAA